MSKHVFEHANRCQCYMMPYFFLDATKFGLLSFFTLIETIARTFGQNHRRRTQKFHFWLACVAQRRLCLNSLNWFQFCFPLYINFNKKYDVVQNFLLKVLQSQTKVVGILPPNAVFFLLLARPLVLQMLFIAVNPPNLAHQHWEGKKIVKRANNSDWDCRFVKEMFPLLLTIYAFIYPWNVHTPPPPLHGVHFCLRPPPPGISVIIQLDWVLFGNNVWVTNIVARYHYAKDN